MTFLSADDMTTPSVKEGSQAAGINSILPKEQLANFMVLPILRAYSDQESVSVDNRFNFKCPYSGILSVLLSRKTGTFFYLFFH